VLCFENVKISETLKPCATLGQRALARQQQQQYQQYQQKQKQQLEWKE